MDKDKKILHFSFGPVQGFVAQARRTRDLWAGSYLLSYLAGCAMKAVKDAKGQVLMPAVAADPLFQALTDPGKKPRSADDLAAQIGSLPNRFKAEVPADFDGQRCADAIEEKWNAIAEEVRTKSNSIGITIDPDIWKRQVTDFWDCTWVYGESDALLDTRKNLRTHHPASEDGEKCTLCGERQEVSGKGMGSSSSRKDMKDWWAKARECLTRNEKATLFDLKENERLCAVCLVKRAYPFPEIAKQEKAIGWPVPVNYPSTAYMAAIDWLIAVLAQCEKNTSVMESIVAFIKAAETAKVRRSEAATRIDGITAAGKASGLTNWEYLADLDGGAFFESVIENKEEFEVEGDSPGSNTNRDALLRALKAVHEELGRARAAASLGNADGIPPPVKATPFYAHLLMDGDNMGKLLSEHKDKQTGISCALALFTGKVPKIVSSHNGRLIYAGGDDVFALLPVDTAIACTVACHDAYLQVFKDTVPDIAEKFTISAAIEYAHIHSALGVIVRDAHDLLDRHAKEDCNRDGLACRVWKRGGPVLVWAQPWEVVLNGSGTNLVDEVKRLFQNNSNDPGRFSSKFFYKARELFEILEPKRGATVLSDQQKQSLLVAEYLSTREHKWDRKWDKKRIQLEAEARIKPFVELCRAHKSVPGASPSPGRLTADGALLVRFLSQKEV